MTTAEWRVEEENLIEACEGDMAEATTDSRWHLEAYMKRWGKALDGRRFRAIAADGSSPYIYDWRPVRSDTWVGAWRSW